MFRSFRKFTSPVLAIAFLVGVASALTSLPMKEKGAGVLTEVAPGFLAFAAQGTSTHLGKYTETGSANVDLLGNVSNGQFTFIGADGSTLSGTFAGTYAPLPTGQIRLDVSVTWGSGTGRMAGATGASTVVAVVNGLEPGATFVSEGIGTLQLP